MSAGAKRALNEEGYLALERNAAIKSEFSNGEMVAMASAKSPHNKIAFNLSVAIGRRLGNSCSGYTKDMKVRTENGAVYYPEIVFTCGTERCRDSSNDVLLNPVVIIEVLSRSASSKDRGEKRLIIKPSPRSGRICSFPRKKSLSRFTCAKASYGPYRSEGPSYVCSARRNLLPGFLKDYCAAASTSRGSGFPRFAYLTLPSGPIRYTVRFGTNHASEW